MHHPSQRGSSIVIWWSGVKTLLTCLNIIYIIEKIDALCRIEIYFQHANGEFVMHQMCPKLPPWGVTAFLSMGRKSLEPSPWLSVSAWKAVSWDRTGPLISEQLMSFARWKSIKNARGFYTKAPGKTKARDATGFDIFWKNKYGSADEKEQVTRWIKVKHLTYQLYPLFDGVFYRCSIQHFRFKFSGKCVETLAIHCQQVMQIRCMWYL